MAVLLQRVCWNDNQWKGPSPGRTGLEDSYVGKRGFGHEDWNFNKRDALDGWIFGYVYKDFDAVRNSLGEGPHRIYFWARENPTSERYLVGVYRLANFIRSPERTRVLREFRRRGILNRRIQDLKGLGLPSKVFQRYGSPRDLVEGDFAVSIAARVEDVRVFDPMVPVSRVVSPRSADWSKYWRYFGYKRYDNHDPFEKLLRGWSPSDGPLPFEDPNLPERAPSKRHVSASDGEMTHREYNMTGRLQRFLSQPDRGLRCTPFKRYMDMVVERRNRYCLLELKSCADETPKKRVREALGQLLYYAHHRGAHTFFSSGREPAILCAVIDEKPEAETKEWIRKLRRRLKINLDLMWEESPGVFTSLFDWPGRL